MTEKIEQTDIPEFELEEQADTEEFRAEGSTEVPLEADPVDTQEQRAEVRLDEDHERES